MRRLLSLGRPLTAEGQTSVAGSNVKRRARIGYRLFVVAIGVLALPRAQVAAQTPSTGEPRVELGLNGVLFTGYMDLSEFRSDPQLGMIGAGPTLRVNVSERFALESHATISRIEDVSVTVYELSVVVKRRAPSRKPSLPFLRVGAGGRHEFEHVKESRHENQDYSTTVWPAYDHHKLTLPNFIVVGAGLQFVASRHLAVIGELGGVVGSPGLGFRASAGVMVPIGSYGSR